MAKRVTATALAKAQTTTKATAKAAGAAPAQQAASPRRRPTRRSAADRAAAERLLAILKHGGDVRARKSRRTRAAIKVRRYENPLKLDIAVNRLIEEVVG